MNRWKIDRRLESISWDVKGGRHHEDIEMSGAGTSQIVIYGIEDDGCFMLTVSTLYPSLRCTPNNTHATFNTAVGYRYNEIPRLLSNGVLIDETPTRVTLDGTVRIETEGNGFKFTHCLFPSVTERASYDIVTVKNTGKAAVTLTTDHPRRRIHNEEMGPYGVNLAEISHDIAPQIELLPGEEYTYNISFTGRLVSEDVPSADPAAELRARREFVRTLKEPLQLDTGCDVLDTEFAFAKLRACESVFDTKCGPIHSPGGYSYYAAIWCNDEVEYASPFFAYTGNARLTEAAINSYKLYIPFMSQSYMPIPSSIIAEGTNFWNGAGDRGDAAMYLYGASHFALTNGDRETAEELLPAIEWCAEYCRRKLNSDGVIASDNDELEGRFPSGDANLCTQALAISGLRAAARLEREIGVSELADTYAERADALEAATEAFFGAEIHGFKTYRYYDGCKVLRSWICMPLCVGMTSRREGTASALLSKYLLTPDGMKTSEEKDTIWDRSTLYCLRGLFAAELSERAMPELMKYSEARLLGNRVPYPVEAYPEGDRRHLSGESALYCKIFTDGILRMEPDGLRSFTIDPMLPPGLDHFYLKNIRAHGGEFDVLLEADSFRVTMGDSTLAEAPYGKRITVTLGEA